MPNALFYKTCLLLIQVTCLLTFYLAGNYFVVQQLSSMVTGASPSAPIPFGFIFWIFTVAIPFLYIAWGVQSKSVVRLRTGLLLIAAAVFTFRYYYHVLPTEGALVLGGAVMLAVSYAFIRYLKAPKHGFTYVEPKRKVIMDHLKVESMIVGETFAHTPGPSAEPGNRFGGGSFGGGGSSSNY